ncbi:MAG: CDP-alcohol phosphatidyltransferase family protein [Deltaproteobacteria bacterium]|nr:MAG: CDP-alcohol phosphatidyltransferase family protein [Deltaproteobacteria bacterium]
MLGEVAQVYRASKKRRDINWFTEWLCRPPAALFVYAIRNTRITPNQVTFLSAALCAAACGVWLAWPGWTGAVAGALVFELSFVLDCADGQLARLRGTASVLGHLLDFLMDEVKAFLVFGTVAIRLWIGSGDAVYLLCGVAGLVALASGIAMTSFTRRPEYGAKPPTADGQPHQPVSRAGALGRALGAFEWLARFVVHYPQYIWLCALVDRLDVYLWAYGAVNALYAGYVSLGLVLRLGRGA